MGQVVHNERYEDIVLEAVPAEYEKVWFVSYEKRDFGLDEIRHMVHHTMFVDYLSYHFISKAIANSDLAMQAAERNGSDVQCNYFKGIGDLLQGSTTLKVDKYRYGAIPRSTTT